MKEFEAAVFNKETAAQGTEKKTEQRKISLLCAQFVNCLRVIKWDRIMFVNFVTGQILRFTVRFSLSLPPGVPCCLSLLLGVHVSNADRA